MKLDTNYKNITGIGLLVVFIGLLLYDILPATNSAEGDTISEVLQNLPRVGILLAGYFMGHFWPTDQILRFLWAKPDSAESAEEPPAKT